MNNDNNQLKCKVITGKNGDSEEKIIIEEESLNINPDNYDIYIDRVRMRVYIRLKSGKSIKFNGQIQRVDGKPIELLKRLMMRPARYLAPYDIGNIGEYDESFFIKDNIISYAAKLRKYLFPGDGYRYIKTASRPYKIALSGDISFCWIELFQEGNKNE